MGSSIGRFIPCQKDDSHPWLQYPDGKWSPPPSRPANCKWAYEVDGYSLEAEREQINRWKDLSGWSRRRCETATNLCGLTATVLVEVSLERRFTVTLRHVIGVGNWQGQRSTEDFEGLYYGILDERHVLNPPTCLQRHRDIFMSPIMWSFTSREISVALQQWLKEVVDAGLATSKAFRHFASTSQTRFSPDDHSKTPSNVALSLPIMTEILAFLDEPRDLCHASATLSKSLQESSTQLRAMHWERIYQAKWPAFHEAQRHHMLACSVDVDWQELYASTIAGKLDFLVEVFEREKKLGFAMSCMMAKVTWEESTHSYIAHYISASQVLPERISQSQRHRLRYCPASARPELKPELAENQGYYAYRVLTGLPDLQKGQAVELQWRMQEGSPFGWWYGTVETVDRHSDGVQATVTMVFRHFPATSRWYRLQVTVGDGTMQRCAIGGYHGGLRLVSEEEDKRWMHIFPKDPVIF